MGNDDTPKFKTLKQKVRHYTRKDGTGCHQWTGRTNEKGYGIIYWKNGAHKAHRLAYEVFVAPIPEGSVVHHTCSNRACVNPKHLQTITPQENTAEMIERQSYIAKIASLEARLGACTCEQTKAAGN